MKKKQQRLDALRVIISSKKVSSQRDILDELEAAGIKMTQPTLSGYLRELRVSKVRTRGGSQYVLPYEAEYVRPISSVAMSEFLRQANIMNVAFSGNLMVLRTMQGYASVLAVELDAQNLPTVAGTLAGVDTLFIAMVDGADRKQFVDDVATCIPAIKSVVL